MLPATLILLLVNTFPLLYSCYISVTNYSLSDPDTSSFVGLNNFVIAFRDQMLLNSLLDQQGLARTFPNAVVRLKGLPRAAKRKIFACNKYRRGRYSIEQGEKTKG